MCLAKSNTVAKLNEFTVGCAELENKAAFGKFAMNSKRPQLGWKRSWPPSFYVGKANDFCSIKSINVEREMTFNRINRNVAGF